MRGKRIVVGNVDRTATSTEQNVIPKQDANPTRWKCHNIQCPLRIHKYMWPIFALAAAQPATLLSLSLYGVRPKKSERFGASHVFNMIQANEIFRDSSKWTDLYTTVFGVASSSTTFRYNKDFVHEMCGRTIVLVSICMRCLICSVQIDVASSVHREFRTVWPLFQCFFFVSIPTWYDCVWQCTALNTMHNMTSFHN